MDALEYIHQIPWQERTPGLHRMRALLARLGNPHEAIPFVHVAGTNGKGSTCVSIATVLQEAGYRVGLNTSPYIYHFYERIQVGGVCITPEELRALVERIRPVVESMDADLRPSEFELITALALMHFVDKRCDIAVLEVGLGGLLDASNVIPTPAVAVITAIGLDHTALLGDSIAQIARAKGGIIKPHGCVVYDGASVEANDVLCEMAQAQNAQGHPVDAGRLSVVSHDVDGALVHLRPYGEMRLGLAGAFQPRNALVAVTALECLIQQGWSIPPEAMRRGLAKVRWPGRFEVVHRRPTVILDGAHNPQGMQATLDSLALMGLWQGDLHLVLGVLADKEVDALLVCLSLLDVVIYAVTPPSPRAMDAVHLQERLQALGVTAKAFDSIEQGLDAAVHAAGEAGTVLACGSLYLCAPVSRWGEGL